MKFYNFNTNDLLIDVFEGDETHEVSCGSIIYKDNKYYRVISFDITDNSKCYVSEINLNFNNTLFEDTVVRCPVCGEFISDEIDENLESCDCSSCGSILSISKLITYVIDVEEGPEIIDL